MSKRIQPLSILLLVLDLGMVLIGLFIASKLRAFIPLGTGGALAEEHVAVPWFVYLLALVCWVIGMLTSGAYSPLLSLRWFNEAWRVLWGSTLATGLMAGTLYMSYRELSRLQFIYFYIVTLGMMLAYRAALRLSYRALGKGRPGARSRVLVVGAGELGEKLASVIRDHSRWGFELVGFLDDDEAKQGSAPLGCPVLGTIDSVQQVVDRENIDEVWTALPAGAQRRLAELVSALERNPVRIKVVPDYFSLALVRANAEMMGGIPIIGIRDPLIEGVPRLIKRGFDLLVTSLVLIPASPFLGLIALSIKLDSKGPAILKQKRVGENGRIFDMHKFRTMTAGSEEMPVEIPAEGDEGPILHKRRDDPRVTRVGRFLRRFSLDELPQLFNVLKGEMSLVGPRPEMPWLVDRYESWQRKRFAVPQGLTGWWQINGRSDKPMHLHTEDDLYYVYNYSLWMDIKILARTPLAVLTGRGAF